MAGHIARQPFAWRNMHTETWCRVHFKYHTACFIQRLTQVLSHNVDAADIKTDDLGDPLADEHVLWVHVIGHINRSTTGTQIGC